MDINEFVKDSKHEHKLIDERRYSYGYGCGHGCNDEDNVDCTYVYRDGFMFTRYSSLGVGISIGSGGLKCDSKW